MKDITLIARMFCNAFEDDRYDLVYATFLGIQDRIIKIGNMAVIFYRLNDDSFKTIKGNKQLLGNQDLSRKWFLEEGDNIHLIKAFGRSRQDFRKILNFLIDKYNPKTLTWYRDNRDKIQDIKYKRRILCLG